MQTAGRPVMPFTEEQAEIINEYLDSDMTYAEIAEKYKVPDSSVKYWVGKYRRLNQNVRNKGSERLYLYTESAEAYLLWVIQYNDMCRNEQIGALGHKIACLNYLLRIAERDSHLKALTVPAEELDGDETFLFELERQCLLTPVGKQQKRLMFDKRYFGTANWKHLKHVSVFKRGAYGSPKSGLAVRIEFCYDDRVCEAYDLGDDGQ